MSNKLIKPSNENKIIIDDGSKSYTIENKKEKNLVCLSSVHQIQIS